MTARGLAAMDQGTRVAALPLPALGTLLAAFGLGWGYISVWIPHEAAGLAVLGVDFLTYIKLLPAADMPVVFRMSWLWCLPLLTASVTLSQAVWSQKIRGTGSPVLNWCGRLLLIALALYFSLHVLPLDWSPDNLIWPSNRFQTVIFFLSTGLAATGPLTGSALMQKAHWWLPILALGSLVTALAALVSFLPVFRTLYAQVLVPGPGFYVSCFSALCLAGLSISTGWKRQW